MSRSIDCTTPRVNGHVDCGLWVIMMCQHRLIRCNKWTALVWDVGDEGGCACVGTRDLRGNSVHFNFAVNLTLL